MEKYQYTKELPPPISVGNFNFEHPMFLSLLKRIGPRFLNQAYKYKPKSQLIKKTVKIPLSDGETISCYVIEPKDTFYSATEPLSNFSPKPVIFYFHGGGFFFPLQKMMLDNASYYANALNCIVILPEYRLLPDHPFPTPLNDCYNAFCYFQNNADSFHINMEQLILYGDSAGGCLASGMALRLRDESGPKAKGQMLIYPVTCHTSSHPSMDQYKDSVWSKSANIHMWNLYLKNFKDVPNHAPPLQQENLEHLPPTYIEPQEIDSLCDEAIAFGEKLKLAHNQVQINFIKGSYHGFDRNFKAPFVQAILKHRCHVMEQMLSSNE